MPPFTIESDFQPTGDQPQAVEQLTQGLGAGYGHQTLLGATGTGKTFTIANVIERTQRPALVMAHNKTLAAQLYAEFRVLFPRNAVEYFVSYYDYYQPEAYVPRHDLYIEKSTKINDHIERLRLAACAALNYRRDVIVVASVSCIYGFGDPQAWQKLTVELRVGDVIRRDALLRKLVTIQYTRNDYDLRRGAFRARGDTLEIFPAYAETAFRITLFGDEVERIVEFDPLTGELLTTHNSLLVYPAREYVTDVEKLRLAVHDIENELKEHLEFLRSQDKLVEAQRLEQRVNYDIEMLREVGFTSGVENYSRHLEQRPAGSSPYTLIDYFPDDFLLVIDESHMTIPQIRAMYNGDRSRKTVLVDFGFRLPSALDNRPLKFDEFRERTGQTIYTTATPGPYEQEESAAIVQQVIRPTGILDPIVEIRPQEGQIEDLLQEVAQRISVGQRALITTLTQRMAEDLADYLVEAGIRAQYLHAEVDTFDRVEILRDLRQGVYDAVVGINLLREGLDLPEVSLVAILDADKEGFLRSESALVQNIGRAARHVDGKVILYAGYETPSMARAIKETRRRRELQHAHNQAHGIEPATIVKEIRDLTDRVRTMVDEDRRSEVGLDGDLSPGSLPPEEKQRLIKELEREMKGAAQMLEFEKAALLRDQIIELRAALVLQQAGGDALEAERTLATLDLDTQGAP
ncbi:MAG: excinuclease ABC subunit UvrB [Anaerolineaceae bacterium]|nr:excinuclease ABC subunit UvrB [Anaerolineaceae bacterium]